MAKGKQHVHFTAHKNVKEPALISFPTKKGLVAFEGHKLVKEEVVVDFNAKK